MTKDYSDSQYKRESAKTLPQFEVRSFWAPYIPWFVYGCVLGLVLFGLYTWLVPKDETVALSHSSSALQPLRANGSDENLGQVTETTAAAGSAQGIAQSSHTQTQIQARTQAQAQQAEGQSQAQAQAQSQNSAPTQTQVAQSQTAESESTTSEHPTFDFYTVLPEGEGSKLSPDHANPPAPAAQSAQTTTQTESPTNVAAQSSAPAATTTTPNATASNTVAKQNAQAPSPESVTARATDTAQNSAAASSSAAATAAPIVPNTKSAAPVSTANAANTAKSANTLSASALVRKNQQASSSNNAAVSAANIAKTRKQGRDVSAAAQQQSPTNSATPLAAAGKKVMLQIASFRSFKDADELRADLLLEGFAPKIRHIEDDEHMQTLHRVLLGPYDQADARKQCQSVRTLGYDCLIVTRF